MKITFDKTFHTKQKARKSENWRRNENFEEKEEFGQKKKEKYETWQ